MKNVTIYTIAEELNMTPSIVSRAFNPKANVNAKKRELILETAKKYNFVPNKMASRLSMKEMVIGVLLYLGFEPCYSELIRGINAAQENLKDYKIKCDLRFLDTHKDSIDKCREVLNGFAKYDGIIVAGIGHENYADILDEIYEKNHNIVILQTHSTGEKKLFASRFDIDSSAKAAVEFLHNCMFFSKRKNVVLFTGRLTSGTHMQSRQTFLKEAESYGFNILAEYDMGDSGEKLKAICENELSGYIDDVDGIYITSGNSIELCKYIEENNKTESIALVTFDTYPELNEYIKKGVINATIYQNLYGQAKQAYENLFYHISEGRKVPEVIGINCETVMKYNINLYENKL